VSSPSKEQKIRAERMANFGVFKTILPDALTPDVLENAIDKQLHAAKAMPHYLFTSIWVHFPTSPRC